MKKLVLSPASKMVSLSRGLYSRVAHRVGCDVSYISRIARGERKSKVAEKALDREFRKVSALITKNSGRPDRH